MVASRVPASLQQVVAITVLFGILAVASTWPIARDPAHLSVIEPTENDYRLNTYFIFWGAHALVEDPLGVHHTNMFHPERYTFVYADILLAHSLLMLPVIWFFYHPVLTYNLLLLLSIVIGGVGFWLLARTATGSSAAALLGAALWVFNPVHFTRFQQIQLFGDHWLPWMAWALWHWLRPSSQRTTSYQRYRWPVAAACFFCLDALSGSHHAVFGAFLGGGMMLYFAVADGLWRDRSFRRGAVAFVLIAVAVLAPIFWPYVVVEEAMAARRAETLDLADASLRPYEFFSARSHFYTWLDETIGWPSVVNRSNRELRTYSFPGVVPILLAILGLAWLQGERRREQRFWLIATLAFVFLAMGAYGGYLIVGNLPLLRLIRVPTRFMLPAVFCLAVLGAYGAASVLDRHGRRATIVLTLAAAVFAGEALFAPLRTWPYDYQPHPVNEFLAAQPGDFAVVEFPLDPTGYSINMRQLFNSIYHWKKLMVGYSGYQSAENVNLLRSIRDRFPNAECLDDLNRLDVRFAILLQDRVDEEMLQAVAEQPRLELVWARDRRLVYAIH